VNLKVLTMGCWRRKLNWSSDQVIAYWCDILYEFSWDIDQGIIVYGTINVLHSIYTHFSILLYIAKARQGEPWKMLKSSQQLLTRPTYAKLN